MAAYTLGLRKAGQFHLISFEERELESLNPCVPHCHDFYELIWLPNGHGLVQSDLRGCGFLQRT